MRCGTDTSSSVLLDRADDVEPLDVTDIALAVRVVRALFDMMTSSLAGGDSSDRRAAALKLEDDGECVRTGRIRCAGSNASDEGVARMTGLNGSPFATSGDCSTSVLEVEVEVEFDSAGDVRGVDIAVLPDEEPDAASGCGDSRETFGGGVADANARLDTLGGSLEASALGLIS